jgi:hypothetical protein
MGKIFGRGLDPDPLGENAVPNILQTARRLRDTSNAAKFLWPPIEEREKHENRCSARSYEDSHRVFAQSASRPCENGLGMMEAARDCSGGRFSFVAA